MEKIEQIVVKDKFFKVYHKEDLDVLNFISEIQENGVLINYVEVKEDVELDMQTISGWRLSVDEFQQNYGVIELKGRELSYYIDSLLNEKSLNFTLNPTTNNIALVTDNATLELDDLISQKKTR